MKKRTPTTFDDLHAEFPNSRIRDGTLKKLKPNSVKLYIVLSAFKNYNTNESRIGYETIKQFTPLTSGTRIREAIAELEKANLVETHLQSKTKIDGTEGKHTTRKYIIKEQVK